MFAGKHRDGIVCKNCGATFSVPSPASGHSYNIWNKGERPCPACECTQEQWRDAGGSRYRWNQDSGRELGTDLFSGDGCGTTLDTILQNHEALWLVNKPKPVEMPILLPMKKREKVVVR